jgi:hypothetical protein
MDEPAGGERDAGLRPTLQRLVAGGIALARTRLELASVELAEERARFHLDRRARGRRRRARDARARRAHAVRRRLLLGHAPLRGDRGARVVYGALAAFAFLRAGAIARRQPTPFAATIAELDKDRRWLAGGPPSTP